MPASFEFGRKTNQYNNTDGKVKCSECLEYRPLEKVESDGYKYICEGCKEDE